MNPRAVLHKTEKGLEEMQTRKHKLDQRLRAVLIAVNGRATGAEFVEKFRQLGDVTPALEQLLAGGFIREAAGEAGFAETRGELARSLTDALGPPGDPMVMQLERCKSAEEARAVVERHRPTLEQVAGPRGRAFLEKARRLLG
jgi:hypothetical protein